MFYTAYRTSEYFWIYHLFTILFFFFCPISSKWPPLSKDKSKFWFGYATLLYRSSRYKMPSKKKPLDEGEQNINSVLNRFQVGYRSRATVGKKNIMMLLAKFSLTCENLGLHELSVPDSFITGELPQKTK